MAIAAAVVLLVAVVVAMGLVWETINVEVRKAHAQVINLQISTENERSVVDKIRTAVTLKLNRKTEPKPKQKQRSRKYALDSDSDTDTDTDSDAGSDTDDDPKVIDMVVTWVDGSDAAWHKTLKDTKARYKLHQHDPERSPSTNCSSSSSAPVYDELYYNLLGVAKNAAFVRRVFIVTQRPHSPPWLPDFVDEHPTIRFTVVHHDDFFDDRIPLPTFNSNIIESQVCRIPGLAERFILMNDDFFIIRPTLPHDFFATDGLPIVSLSNIACESCRGLAFGKSLLRGEALARLLGFAGTYGYTDHVPVPLLKSAIARVVEALWPSIASMGPLRSNADFCVQYVVCNILARSLHRPVPHPRLTSAFYTDCHTFLNEKRSVDFVCINRGFDNTCRQRLLQVLNT